MILFLVIVPLLALLTPILAVILVKKNKKHKAEIDALTASNIALSNQLSECQEKLAQALREHSEPERKVAPVWQYEKLRSVILNTDKMKETADSVAKEKIDDVIAMTKDARDAK
ncbi:hypothetical protein CJP72_04235 [Citrobacter sp. NCU1]|uniref:hypothetical protein n=1 Tax=Citrobacter sp. NCU1 TaxID=2026683 RepID=UPI001391BF77|nr:hypothetical protein [Citrobacter sp. NCU1]NDO80015.1 hypothetical protein [Citrobacter sp. NCU1]